MSAVSTPPSLTFSLPLLAQQPTTQAQDPRETKASELLKQGQQQTEARQFDAARQSLQQALNLYQTIKDPAGELSTL